MHADKQCLFVFRMQVGYMFQAGDNDPAFNAPIGLKTGAAGFYKPQAARLKILPQQRFTFRFRHRGKHNYKFRRAMASLWRNKRIAIPQAGTQGI